MNKKKCVDIIYYQTMNKSGLLSKLRENQVDEQGYTDLITALKTLSGYYKNGEDIDRLVAACLFEVPWEIENCVPHYSSQSVKLGEIVSNMSEELIEIIHEMLWQGMDAYYKNL